MTNRASRPRTVSLAAAAVGTCTLGLASLALPTSTSVIERTFAGSLAAAGSAPVRPLADEIAGAPKPADLWLTRTDSAPATAGAAPIGGRISLAVDGGQPIDFKVVGVAELDAAAGQQGAGERLVVVTVREAAPTEGPARVVRLIVDADTPLSRALPRSADRAL